MEPGMGREWRKHPSKVHVPLWRNEDSGEHPHTCSCSSVSRSDSWWQRKGWGRQRGRRFLFHLKSALSRVWRGWNFAILILFCVLVSVLHLNPSACTSRHDSNIQDMFKDHKQNTCCFPRGHGEEKDTEEAGVCVGGSLYRWPRENLLGSVERLVTRSLAWLWLAQSEQLKIHDYLGNQITGKAVTWQFSQAPLFSLHVMFG